MFKHQIIRQHIAGSILSSRVEVEGGAELNLSESIPAAGTNVLLAFVLDVSQLKALTLLSDKALVIKTNNSGSPANTITLVPNQPFQWVTGDPALRDTGGTAINTDITALYVTNPDADNAATFNLRCLSDPTV